MQVPNIPVLVNLVGETKFCVGELVDLKGGYNLEPWLAIELEAGFTHNSISSFGPDPVTNADFYQFPIMANIVLSRALYRNWSVYAGSGFGGVVSQWDCGLQLHGAFPVPFYYPSRANSDTDFVPAYQVLGGIKYAISGRWDFMVGYKFLGTTEGYSWTINGANVKTDPAILQSVFASLTYKF